MTGSDEENAWERGMVIHAERGEVIHVENDLASGGVTGAGNEAGSALGGSEKGGERALANLSVLAGGKHV